MSIPNGKQLGPYEIQSLIGAGGMGEVYKARDTRLNRTVAIKTLAQQLSNNADVKKRFDREAQAVASLNHPHICVLYDVGCHDGIDYIVMEYHWAGGRHSELRLKKSETGKHRHCTSLEAIDVIRKMADKFPNEIAANRLHLRTGADNPWNENRVYSSRHHHGLPVFDPTQSSSSEFVTLEGGSRPKLGAALDRYPNSCALKKFFLLRTGNVAALKRSK